MGTYYHVTLEAYHDWDRTQAIKRCQMHGHPLDAIHTFFSQFPQDEAWTEVQFCIVLTDFQSAIYEDPGFLIRVLEESVWDYDDQSNPIREHYTDMWNEFAITEDNPSILWIMAETFYEGEKIWPGGDSYDEALDARIIYPARFTPKLNASKTDWEGCGWYTEDKGHLQEHLHYGLRHAECRLLKRDLVFVGANDAADLLTLSDHEAGNPATEEAFPLHQASPIRWGDDIGLHAATATRTLTTAGALVPWSPPEGSPTACGTALWALTDDALMIHTAAGSKSFPRPALFDAQPIPGQWKVLLCANGAPATIGPKQLVRWRKDGQWLDKRHPVKRIEQLICGSDDTIWWTDGETLHSSDATGQVTSYDKQHGLMGRIESLIPLPHGILWIVTSERFNKLQQVHTGASRIHPPEGIHELVPEGVAGGYMAPDGDLWLLTQYSHLLRLRENEKPRYYAFDETMPVTGVQRWYEPTQRLHVSPRGDLFCCRGDKGYWLSADTIAACDEQPSLNDELFLPGQLKAFHFPQPQPEESIDLRGKRFYLIGKLDTLTQSQAPRLLARYGARYGSTLSKNVTHVIRGTNTQKYATNWNKRRSYWDKISQAEKMLKPILTEAEFLRLLAKAQPVS